MTLFYDKIPSTSLQLHGTTPRTVFRPNHVDFNLHGGVEDVGKRAWPSSHILLAKLNNSAARKHIDNTGTVTLRSGFSTSLCGVTLGMLEVSSYDQCSAQAAV